jgi:DNA-directed RNA polymerase subunit E'/Rpb7
MIEGGVSFGIGKMQLLLNKHKDMDGVSMEISTLEGNYIMTTQKYSLNSNSRTCKCVRKYGLYKTENSLGIHNML